MKTALPVVLAAACAAAFFVRDARAGDPPTQASSSAPTFGSLAAGSITPVPKDKAPAHIPASEKVDGFFVAAPSKQMLGPDGKIGWVMVYPTDQQAKDFTSGKNFGGDSGGNVCFSERATSFGGMDAENGAEWGFDVEPEGRIMAVFKRPPPPKPGSKPTPPKPGAKPVPIPRELEVTAMHQEKFVDGARPTIEMTDAWVDPTTHGARLIGKGSLPLTKLSTTPGGVTIYAARDKDVVHVVARRAQPPADAPNHPPSSMRDFRAASLARQPLVVRLPTGFQDSTQCGFSRIALRAAKGAAEMATFETSVVFVDKPDPKPAASASADSPTLVGMLEDAHEEEQTETRVRPMQISVSSSWSSRDKEPVLSVSLGWIGQEREM